MRRLVFALAAIVLGFNPAVAQSVLIEHRMAASDVAAALHQALAGVQIHLHNLGPLKGGSFHAANAASIKWPAKDGPGRRDRFSLPDSSRVVLGQRYGYYLNHVRGDGVFVAPQPDRLTATLLLKSSGGPAFAGKCVVVAKPQSACRIAGESAMPSLDWRDARIDIDLVPVAHRDSLAFEVSAVAISGDIAVGTVCNWAVVGAKVCAGLNSTAETTRKKIAGEIRASLNDEQVKRNVAASVRDYLDKTAEVPLLGVKRVVMQDGFVTVGLGLRF